MLGESWSINHNLEWERLRYLATSIFNARAEKSSQMIKPTMLFKLPQDSLLADMIKLPTKAETRSVIDRFNKALKKVREGQ